jgi:hypothetical protein
VSDEPPAAGDLGWLEVGDTNVVASEPLVLSTLSLIGLGNNCWQTMGTVELG